MKNKGFTLVELLAVIVILGIIALIATPIILNIIRNARTEANQRSIDMYASAVKNAIATYEMKEADSPSTIEDVEKYITYDGDPVACATKKLYNNGEIYLGDCTVDGKTVDYEYGFEKGVLEKVCKPADGSSTYSTTPGTKYDCKVDPNKPEYTFYVLNSDTESVNLIMDSNINAKGEAVKSDSLDDLGMVAWISKSDYTSKEIGGTEAEWDSQSSGNTNKGPITAMNYLEEATKSWTNLEEMKINKFEECDNSNNANCTRKTMAKTYNTYARMPYVNEIEFYNLTTGDYLYLYEYLEGSYNFGTSPNIIQSNTIQTLRGYWVLAIFEYDGQNPAFAVCNEGDVEPFGASTSDSFGVRPVITLAS